MENEGMEDIGVVYFVGFDVGSSSVHYVVLSGDKKLIYSPEPIMHFANPIGAIKEAWADVTQQFREGRIKSTAFTGSNAKSFPSVIEGLTYGFDSVTIPKGADLVGPEAKFIFHIGAKDSFFFSVKRIGRKKVIQEWRTGTKCGGGSGILIEKQCRRLFEGEFPNADVEDALTTGGKDEEGQIGINNRQLLQARLEQIFSAAEKEAERSKEPCEFLARCGVVIQSDLIHKQNEGAKREDSLAGLFKTVARNYKIDVLGARRFDSKKSNIAIATGGVFSNDLIRWNLEEILGISVARPENYQNIAAVGAVLKAIEENNSVVFNIERLREVAEHGRGKRQFTQPLSSCLEKVNDQSEELAEEIEKGTEIVVGIDGGSTTTKGALVDLKGKLLDKIYIKTYGDPEGSLKKVIKYLGRHQDNVIVKGIGATGSARKLYEKILISKQETEALMERGISITDRITDEITCHALGVKHYDSDIDTIFEIGGQDMKFTSFANDVVKEAKMNYSCQAGSGQTLENMADVIDLNVETSLQESALNAKRIPTIDATCGVFMEMDENRLIAEGFDKEEIAAAILRGTAASYYYKFVGGSQHVGTKCSAQGGPPLGQAFLAALAQVTGKEIEAYPHREMFGAWGQALDIIENMKQLEKQSRPFKSAFRGWDLVDKSFEKERASCRVLFGEKSCGVRDCQLEIFSIDEDRIITGGFCPRGDSESATKPKTNYVNKYHRIYEKHFKKKGSLLEDISNADVGVGTKGTVGIKRSTATLGEKGIWSAALLKKLGFHPVVSPRSSKEIAKIGVDNSRTDFCIARKLVTGHAAILNENPNIEYLFNPSFIELRQSNPPDLKYCIYTESEGYILNDVLSLDLTKQINPVLHFGDENLLVHSLKEELKRLNFHFSNKEIRDSIRYADKAEEEFKRELYDVGDKFLSKIEEINEKAYVGIGRDYVLLDPEASSNSGVMFSQVRGLHYIPQIFLEHRFEDIPLDNVAENEFWVQSVKILKANLFVAGHPNLFPIRMMNFACGPDSLKVYQEEHIHEAVGKPLLTLLTDAQTNNAPFVTRTEAHERVVNQTKPGKLRIEDLQLRKCSTDNNGQRIWLIPYMGDAAHVAVSALKHFGINGRVLPTNTQNGYEIARRHIHTEVCHPLKGVVGDAMGFLSEQIEKEGKQYVEDNYLVMLPTTSGPCRFGKYTEVLRILMDREGLGKVPIAGPSSETDYFDIPVPEKVGASNKLEIQKVLFKGINASDLLEDITLRYRPYAEDKQHINNLKKERLYVLGEVIENGAGTAELIEWGKETVSKYTQAKLRYRERFPLVLYIGEIYMRQHDPYTGFVIQKLEDKQLEMVRDPITDWLLYVNQMNRRNSRRDIRLSIKNWDLARAWNETRKLARSFLKGKYMSNIADKISQPFHEVLHGRHCLPKPIDIIDTLEKNHKFHGNIEGESPLSTGIAYYFMNELIKPKGNAYISGIFHVGPFTCMQEGVATAKIEAMAKELRKIKDNLVFPIIHAFFGDSPNPNLDAEIAVFTEQCYQKRDMLKEKCGSGLSIDTTSHSTSMRSPSQMVDIDNKKRAPRVYEKVD
jgi:activator of 2-hydroxyglutaryl-CoA dehydratase/predicted nucleotide-binding protein (sugar kinase/HSP70/actin superfamily)